MFMRRAAHPNEILLGFFAGLIAALCIQQPLIWLLYSLGLTAQQTFSTFQTTPLGVEAGWSRVFWGGAFGVALAWFGTRYALGLRWLLATTSFAAGVRTIAAWFIVPMFYGRAWVGWSADAILTPLVLNVVWASGTAILLAAATIAAGTWGMKSRI
jgi:hypothetical protein